MPPLTKRPKRNTGPWSSLRILTSTSPLLAKDIHPFLVTCVSGWSDKYNEEEKRAIIDSLPPKYRKYEAGADGRLICPISVEFVLDDPYIKTAVTKFQKDVSESCYEKGWQNQAKKAMQERQDGRFDGHLREDAEDTFGINQDGSGTGEIVDTVQPVVDSDDGEWDGRETRGRRSAGRNALIKRKG